MQEDYSMNKELKDHFGKSVLVCSGFYRLLEFKFNDVKQQLIKDLQNLQNTGEDCSRNVFVEGVESSLHFSIKPTQVSDAIEFLQKHTIETWCVDCLEDLGIAFIYEPEINNLSLLYATRIYYKEHLQNLINVADLWDFDAQTIINYLVKPQQ
jgi:hypothetical protein